MPKPQTKIVTYLDKDRAPRWRLRDPSNGEIVGAAHKAFDTFGDIVLSIVRLKEVLTDLKLAEVVFYQEDSEEKDWRWTLKDPEAGFDIITASTEGYRKRADCEANLARLGELITGTLRVTIFLDDRDPVQLHKQDD